MFFAFPAVVMHKHIVVSQSLNDNNQRMVVSSALQDSNIFLAVHLKLPVAQQDRQSTLLILSSKILLRDERYGNLVE